MAHTEIEEIPSIEELDKRLVVVSPKGWIALLITSFLILGAILWAFFGEIPTVLETEVILLNEEGFEIIRSKATGLVKEMLVTRGQSVEPGDGIATLEQEDHKIITIKSEESGEIVELFVDKDDKIDVGGLIGLIQKGKGDFNFYAFLPIEKGQQIQKGMKAYVQPTGINVQKYGSILANVAYVSPYVVSKARLLHLLGMESLIPFFTQNQPVVEVLIDPEESDKNPSGYEWTSGVGPPEKILPRMVGKALITLDTRRPITYVLPVWRFKKVTYELKAKSKDAKG